MKDQIEDGYYYPTPDEIRVGMEVEIKGHFEWVNMKTIKDYLPMAVSLSYMGDIRIPLLTREQIEAEGWRYENSLPGLIKFSHGEKRVLWESRTQSILFMHEKTSFKVPTIYHFRDLMKMAGIKQKANA